MALQYAAVAPQALYVHEKTNLDFLDDVLDKLVRGNVDIGMVELGNKLYELYASTSDNEWEYLLNNHLLKHPIKNILMQDPHTARSFRQPRGYAGDAVLLDMVYFPHKTDLSRTSDIAIELYNFNTRSRIAHALRKRMVSISQYIDDTAANVNNARVLSVACGHCREAEFSNALQELKIGTFVGIDQDSRSLSIAERKYGSSKFKLKHIPIIDLIKGNKLEGKFDLIYSAGLYDYLSKRIAQKLTQRLYDMLTENGKLVLYNIKHNFEEIGYFESFMNWSMIGRTKSETLEFSAELQGTENAILNTMERDAINSHFHILEIARRPYRHINL